MTETGPAAISRRSMAIASTAVVLGAGRLRAQHFGPAPHKKGPLVFLDYDQAELDAAYDQNVYEPNLPQIAARLASNSALTRKRIGMPERVAYGTGEAEKLDIFTTRTADAPICVFVHGGSWRLGHASDYSYLAETLTNAGAHCVIPDFSWVQDVSGSLVPLAQQVCSAIAWTWRNAANFGGNNSRFFVAGHSSGAHLAGVALTADWKKDYGLEPGFIKGAFCVSGIYDLKPVRLSARSSYIKFNDEVEAELSPLRHIERLHTPMIVTYGTFETPEFQRQNREFVAAVKGLGKPIQLITAENYAHMEMVESLGNPYSILSRALTEQIGVG